jgi:nitrous oxidase accessory protein
VLLALPACGGVLVVGEAGPYRSIREAIARASAGDTIRVERGVWPGNLVIDKPLTLEGAGRPVIRGDGRDSVVTVLAPDTTIRNFVIEHSGGMLVDEDSGILLKADGARLEYNEFRDVLFGIYLYHSSRNILTGNTIRGRPELELGERGSGIHIWYSSENTITGNSVTDTRDGMYLEYASRSMIKDNRIYRLRYGLHYMFSDDNWFEDNVFYDNVAGAAIMYSRRIEFRRNAFVKNRGFASFGILFQDSRDCVAEDNLVADNAVGFFMEAQRTSTFRRNTVAFNDVAIRTFSNAAENTFRWNNFIGNLSPIEVIGKRTDNNWSDQGAGNFWTQYDGYDLNADGIGDVPFRIQNVFERLEGNYPRLRLYLMSPASQALAVSERMFPIIEGSREYDDAPLMKPVEMGRFPPLPVPERTHNGIGWPLVLPAAMVGISIVTMARGRRR